MRWLVCVFGMLSLGGASDALGARDFRAELIQAAKDRTKFHVVYTPDYVALDYPGGDVPEGTGVCTDNGHSRPTVSLVSTCRFLSTRI